MRNACNLANIMPSQQDEMSPLEMFARSDVRPNFKHYNTFGCPAFALNNDLQAGHKIPKWSSRSCLGIYLGQSPRHSRSISLILNPITGLVSPQYHVSHDDFFETTHPKSGNPKLHSTWQLLAGFTTPSKDQYLSDMVHPNDQPQERIQTSTTAASTAEQPIQITTQHGRRR